MTAPSTFRVRLHPSEEEQAATLATILESPPRLRDEIEVSGSWRMVGELCPEDPWLVRPATMIIGLLAWIQALLMLEVGIHLQLFALMAGSGAAAILLLRHQLRWGMALTTVASVAAITRGALDVARGVSIGLTGGAWLWLVAPALLGGVALVLSLVWWLRSASARPLGARLAAVLTDAEKTDAAIRARVRVRFADVPFGIPLAVGLLAVPYAAHFVRPLSALAFSGLIAAAGVGLLVYALAVRRASARAAGVDPSNLANDMAFAVGVLAMMLVGTYAAFNLLDAIEMALTLLARSAGPVAGGAAAEAAVSIADASAGMAAESAAKDVVVAAGTTWRPWVISVVAGIGEELAFRGGLYAALRNRMSPRWAIPLSAIPFALLHFEPYQTTQLAVGGMVLAALYERRRTLWAPMAVHVVWNLMLTALST